MDNLTIGQKIKFYRERIKKSQMDLEVEIDASTGSISRMENGVVNPTKETLSKIAKVLKLSSKELADLLDIPILNPMQLIAGINKLATSEDLDTTLQAAVDIMFELYPHHNGGGILLLDKDDPTRIKIQSMTRVPTYDAFMSAIPDRLTNFSVSLDSTNFLAQSFTYNKILQSFEVLDFTHDMVPNIVAELAIKIMGFGSGIVMPLILDNVKYGIIFYSKDRQEIFTDDEIETLRLYNDQISISIRNARKFEEMRKELQKLKK